MQYRPEIDGLRSVAVIPVILFHAGISIFNGGYVGVDIFFVISGYLITSILIAELERGDFSILRFYERRARRILPALFVMMTVCIPLAWMWMLPDEIKAFAKSIIAVNFFSSNVLFWQEVDYFAAASEEKPLLHTWSLAVEEQYYLIFPVLLMIAWRWGRNYSFYVILGCALLSLALSELAWRYYPIANFYLLPTRAWELLAGSLCAFWLSARASYPRGSEGAALIGISLIAAAIFLFDAETPFPSLYTLMPVIGTGLIILYAQPGTIVARGLSHTALVGIGLVSYSAYLWHQPLFAFARIRLVHEPELPLMLLLSGLTFALAWLSWRYIERPFRKPGQGPVPTRACVFVYSAAGLLSLTLLAGIAFMRNGEIWRITPQQYERLHALQANVIPHINCIEHETPAASEVCVLGESTSKTRLVAIGDSHVEQWAEVLGLIGQRQGWRVELYSRGACPFAAVEFYYPNFKSVSYQCTEWRKKILAQIKADPPDLVFATSSSAGYLGLTGVATGSPFDFSKRIEMKDWTTGLKHSFLQLTQEDIPILWMFDNPRYTEFHPLKCYMKLQFLHYVPAPDCTVTQSKAVNSEIYDAERTAAAQSPQVTFKAFTDSFCTSGRCRAVRDGIPIMRDGNHISAQVAKTMLDELEKSLTHKMQR